jgi:chromosome segregation ATPase
MDDFQTEANNLQASVNTLTREISANNEAVARMEQEKSALQVQLRSHKDDISKKQAELRELERQASATSQTKQEIKTLQNHAASTTSNAKDALPELRSIRNNLEKCSALVQEKTVKVSTSYRLTDQIVGLLPVVGNNLRRTRMFRRQISAIEQVCDTLNQIHLDAPKLLPSQGTKFLGIKPWNSYVSGIEAASAMPAMCLFETEKIQFGA